jgi:cell division protein FtsZ
MPITPSLLGLAQAEPSIASAASNTPAPERMSRAPRMPRIDELPLPAQNEIRAARRKERDDSHPEKRGTTLMQRLASVGLSRKAEKDERNEARNLIDEDILDIPAFLRRRATT